MSDFHQKNTATYALCFLLTSLAIWQIFITKTEEPHKRIADDAHTTHLKAATDDRAIQIETLETKPQLIEEIHQLMQRVSLLEKLNFDKLGPTDYAARLFGGEVVAVFSTARQDDSIFEKMKAAMSFLYEDFDRRQCIIQDCGMCYVLQGSSGTVLLKLMGNVYLSAITIEHLAHHSLPIKSNIGSALKEFSVWGTNDPFHKGTGVYFGTFTYDYKESFLETFDLESDSNESSFRYVQVNIHSNHGEEYTCLYRIRIHGTLDE